MVPNLTTHDIYNSIVNDFKGAWNSIAANSDPMIGRANFMFARQAMNLLEFAAMLCDTDPSRATIRDFSTELKNIEVLYAASRKVPASWRLYPSSQIFK
jgi:hypothetical protein